MIEKKPCVREECIVLAKQFEDAIKKSVLALDDGFELKIEPMTRFLNCSNCNIECCSYHAIHNMVPKEQRDNKLVKNWFTPALCFRCNWIADNNGEFGREPGLLATVSEIPW